METLYSIMRDLLEVEYNQKSLICILEVLEATYSDEEQKEVKLTTNSIKYYLKVLNGELKMTISRLDTYIVEEAKQQ